MAPGLPRRLAPVLPTTYSPSDLDLAKAYLKGKHSESPCHAFAHCKGFAPAASLRTRTLRSVSFSGLGLSSPILISGLVGRYPTNCRNQPPTHLAALPLRKNAFQRNFPTRACSQFPEVVPDCKVDCRRVTEPYASHLAVARLAWLSRTPIAATSRRINGNYCSLQF